MNLNGWTSQNGILEISKTLNNKAYREVDNRIKQFFYSIIRRETMRDIKFRAWDKLKSEIYTTDFISAFDFESKCIWVKAIGKGGRWLGIRDANIMQYTGIKDKNGVDIYEGDIILKKNEFGSWVGETIFLDGAFKINTGSRFGTNMFDEKDIFEDMGSKSILDNTYEIIGNIYENTELLNQTKS